MASFDGRIDETVLVLLSLLNLCSADDAYGRALAEAKPSAPSAATLQGDYPTRLVVSSASRRRRATLPVLQVPHVHVSARRHQGVEEKHGRLLKKKGPAAKGKDKVGGKKKAGVPGAGKKKGKKRRAARRLARWSELHHHARRQPHWRPLPGLLSVR